MCKLCQVKARVAHALVMCCIVVFRGIVSTIVGSRLPFILELALCFTAFQPVSAHVHHFSSSWHHGTNSEADGSGIVGDDGGTWLFMAEFF